MVLRAGLVKTHSEMHENLAIYSFKDNSQLLIRRNTRKLRGPSSRMGKSNTEFEEKCHATSIKG